MKIETKFSNGDKVYGIQKAYPNDKWVVIGPMLIGQVRCQVTDSPGVDGEEMFDNYKPQNSRTEQYMCVETGIGSGTLHYSFALFSSRDEAADNANILNEKGLKMTDLKELNGMEV